MAKLEEEREQQKAQLAGAEGRKAELQRELGQLHKERVRWSETEAELKKRIRRDLGADFVVRLNYVEHIPRSAGGKFEDFICAIDS